MPSNVKPIPEGCHTANVYLIVENVKSQIAFLERAFGAKEVHRLPLPDGRIAHAEVRIGDSIIMMGQANESWKARPSAIYLYVEDVDSAYRSALQAGAKSLNEPKDQFYGDRNAGVEDSAGNYWWISRHIEDVSPEEVGRRFAAAGR